MARQPKPKPAAKAKRAVPTRQAHQRRTGARPAKDPTLIGPRNKHEIIDRALALLAVSARGLGATAATLKRYAKEYDLLPKLSPQEKSYWLDPKPSEVERARFSWRIEAVRVLLWSVGYVPHSGLPYGKGNPTELWSVVVDKRPDGLRNRAKVRPLPELLRFAGQMRRQHRIVREADGKGERPPWGADPEVVRHWDWAARWLVGHDEWDEIDLER